MRMHSVVEILLLLALALEVQGDCTGALAALEGASNREIAHQLVLCVNTARKHVLNICGKLNVQCRAQAIAKVWVSNGMPPITSDKRGVFLALARSECSETWDPACRFPGKNHPGITPFGYCLVPLLSATLLRETGVTLCQAVSTLRRRNLQCL